MNSQNLEKYNDELSKIYDTVTSEKKYAWVASDRVFNTIEKYLGRDKKVLELGVGTGNVLEKISGYTNKMTGIDISSKMLEKAKVKLPTLQFIKSDLETVDLSALGTFDIVLACGVFEFVDSLEILFEKISQFLNAEGLFCFTYEISAKDFVVNTKLPNIKKNLPKLPFNVFPRNKDQIAAILNKNNFTIVDSFEFDGYLKYNKNEKISIPYGLFLVKK